MPDTITTFGIIIMVQMVVFFSMAISGIAANNKKAARRQELIKLQEFAKQWPVRDNPVEGEVWYKDGHYWVQKAGEAVNIDNWFSEIEKRK
jgi:hypothetical protein